MDAKVFREALADRRELRIIVKGRRTERRYSIPLWFTLKKNKLYLLPVIGSDTSWYKNILVYPRITLIVDGKSLEVEAKPIDEDKLVEEVIEIFKEKYGAKEIQRWYTKLDVAVEISF